MESFALGCKDLPGHCAQVCLGLLGAAGLKGRRPGAGVLPHQ